MVLSQSACLAGKAHTSSTAQADTDAVVADSIDKELIETKKQLDESEPENTTTNSLAPSGRVITGDQKTKLNNESTEITIQNPKEVGKLPKKRSDGSSTIALALGGGGARGAAHLGVLKVLNEEGITIDQIVGNSMGAVVGGLYAAGVPLDEIRSHLEDLSLRKAYMPGGVTKKIASLPFAPLMNTFRPKHYAGLWSGKKLTNYLENILPQPNMDVSDTKIPFSPVATNLLDGKAYRITHGRLSTAIKASAAISPLIQPVAMNDKLFCDGGVRANLPARAARDTGAGLVIAVLVDEPLQPVPAKNFTRMKNIASRISDIVLSITDERQLQYADVIINPNVSSIDVLSKDPADVQRAITAGELAARKALPELRRRLHLPAHAGRGKNGEN